MSNVQSASTMFKTSQQQWPRPCTHLWPSGVLVRCSPVLSGDIQLLSTSGKQKVLPGQRWTWLPRLRVASQSGCISLPCAPGAADDLMCHSFQVDATGKGIYKLKLITWSSVCPVSFAMYINFLCPFCTAICAIRFSFVINVLTVACRNQSCKSWVRSTLYSSPCRFLLRQSNCSFFNSKNAHSASPWTSAVPCCLCSSAAVQPTTPWWPEANRSSGLLNWSKPIGTLFDSKIFQDPNSWSVVILQDLVV